MILTHSQSQAMDRAIRDNDQAAFDQIVANATTGQSNVDSILEVWKLVVDFDRPKMQATLSQHAPGVASADMWLHLAQTDRQGHPVAQALWKTVRVEDLLHSVVFHNQPEWLSVVLSHSRVQRRPTAVTHALGHALREERSACVRVLLQHQARLIPDHMRSLVNQSDDIWNDVFPKLSADCLENLAPVLAKSLLPGSSSRFRQCMLALPAEHQAATWKQVATVAMDATRLPLLEEALSHLEASQWSPLLVSRAHLMKNETVLHWMLPRADLEAVRHQCVSTRPVRWGLLDDLVPHVPQDVAGQWVAQHGQHLPRGRAWLRDQQARQASLPASRRPRSRT